MREMMFVDGFGTVLGSFCGSFLPNTVYLGHPIHKANGASCGYGLANAFTFFFLLNSGIFAMVGAVIPIETMAPIRAVTNHSVSPDSWRRGRDPALDDGGPLGI